MTKFLLNPHFWRITARSHGLLCGVVLVSAAVLAGCTLEVQNRQAVQDVARLSLPPGSVYTGWRVFQDRCAGCHGPAGAGTMSAPDLLPRIRNMSSRQFVGLVLTRYDWNTAVLKANGDGIQRAELIEQVLQRKQGMLTMPMWQGEPRVNAHIVDLYAYLSARANGTQGPDRPVQ